MGTITLQHILGVPMLVINIRYPRNLETLWVVPSGKHMLQVPYRDKYRHHERHLDLDDGQQFIFI